jgi:hypothetical protein
MDSSILVVSTYGVTNNHVRKEGEWFELTDELIHFIINKTDETSYDYKINKPSKNKRVTVATDKVTKRKNWPGPEGYHVWSMREKFISQDNTLRSNWDV